MSDMLHEILEPLMEVDDDECLLAIGHYVAVEWDCECGPAIEEMLKRFVESKNKEY
jgi:hypothetical protein